MKRVTEILRIIFYRYCIVYTLVMGVNVLIAWISATAESAFSVKGLLHIEVMAILCALGDIIFWVGGELSKRQEFIRHIVHYLYINLIVFALAFQTMRMDAGNIILITLTIAVIYWINIIMDFYKNKKDASKMNDLLEKINNNDD